jgi:hypothetical protein
MTGKRPENFIPGGTVPRQIKENRVRMPLAALTTTGKTKNGAKARSDR